MSRYDTDPKYRKAVDEALTGGPSQKALKFKQGFENEIKKAKAAAKGPLKEQDYELAKNNTYNNLGKDLIKKMVVYDDAPVGDYIVSYNPTTKLFTNKNRDIGFRRYEEADHWNKSLGVKNDNLYPTEATPEQVGKLAENLERTRQMTGSRPKVKPVAKPAATVGDKKVRKYILNQIKNKTTVPDFKLNTEIPKVYKPEPPTPEELAAEKKFKKLLDEVEREKEINKRSGIRGLLNEY